MTTELLTAEQFAASRDDLPDGGRWTELVGGKVVALSPPEDQHGRALLNLSQMLADHAQRGLQQSEPQGYAYFELGLIVRRNPDTVRCPAASYFVGGAAFEESDKLVTETRPRLVIEIASSNDRRRDMAERVQTYLDWGVELVWVIDPHARQVHVFQKDRRPQVLAAHQTLAGSGPLAGFKTSVGDIFKEPKWWR